MKRNVLLFLLCAGLLLTGCAGKEPEVISLDLTGDAQNTEGKAELETTASKSGQSVQEQDLYMRYIKNEVAATVGNDYPMNDYLVFKLERGDSYTFAELAGYVNQRYFDPEYSEKTTYDYVQYTYVDCPDSDSRNFLIKFVGLNIYSQNDDSFAVYVLSEKDGQLYLTDEYECWARSGVTAYRNGLCSSSGSSGAGDSYAGVDAILSDGKVTNVYGIEFLSGWWTSHVNETIYNEVFDADMEVMLNIMIYSIGENRYYVYDLSGCTDDQIPLCENYINRCRDEAGINWITDEDAQVLIKERCSSMNVNYDSIEQQQEPDWMTL